VHACPGDLAHMAPAGFRVEAHDITLYGQCADCVKT
jgi:Fur family transcriptional regulator, ferric uptake regulator